MVWVVNATPRPLYSQEREPMTIVQEAGQSGRLWKISPPPELNPQTVLPIASLYMDYAIWKGDCISPEVLNSIEQANSSLCSLKKKKEVNLAS
jgi:hypothetical protein